MSERRLPAREPVSLEQAFRWQCPNCATINYVDPLQIQFESEDERRKACLAFGLIDVWEETPPASIGTFVTAPEVVSCSLCSRKYPAVDESDTIAAEEVDDGDG